MKISKYLSCLILVAACLNTSLVLGHGEGELIVRAGPALVDPDDSNNPVNLAGMPTDFTVSVDDNTQLGITATYMLTDHIGIGLLAATPFKHTVSLENAGGLNGDIVETKHLPPTLTLQYYFAAPSSAFQPYAGIGVNYTYFFDEEAKSSALKDAANTRNVDIDDSLGLAIEAGFDYMITDKLMLNAAVWYLDLDTDASIASDLGEITSEVSIDPYVYMIGLGYKF